MSDTLVTELNHKSGLSRFRASWSPGGLAPLETTSCKEREDGPLQILGSAGSPWSHSWKPSASASVCPGRYRDSPSVRLEVSSLPHTLALICISNWKDIFLLTSAFGNPKVLQIKSSFETFNYLFLISWLSQVLVAARKIFSCSVWDLVSWPGIEPGSPALGAWSPKCVLSRFSHVQLLAT